MEYAWIFYACICGTYRITYANKHSKGHKTILKELTDGNHTHFYSAIARVNKDIHDYIKTVTPEFNKLIPDDYCKFTAKAIESEHVKQKSVQHS
jgi:hypothetical protein